MNVTLSEKLKSDIRGMASLSSELKEYSNGRELKCIVERCPDE